ncbi:MAG: hypothetical protein NTV34_00470 [Proteobacteria bacterium]|nr:hypothetical protein [Pseudomonadota bacterium]
MRSFTRKFALVLTISASSTLSGCSLLSGLMGGGGGAGGLSSLLSSLGKFKPNGLALSDTPQNDLFMTSNDAALANLPYQISPSNKVAAPDGAKLYGFIIAPAPTP